MKHPTRARALITGITGQDGSYLAELLFDKGYEVHGLVRRSSAGHEESLAPVRAAAAAVDQEPHLHHGDLTDPSSVARVIAAARPDEIYNLGAQSHVGISFDLPAYTIDTIVGGTLAILESIRASGRPIRLYQSSSSEMFGAASERPQSESTPLAPQSPYAIAKVAAHQLVAEYRSAYGIYASSGIAFNHESPRRSTNFVTRKVAHAVAEIAAGRARELQLGDLAARRDWGYAPEYVKAMWLMLQQEQPHDLVLATGVSHSVQELCEIAFSYAGLDWRDYVHSDPSQMRPNEINELVGDPAEAQTLIGWSSRTDFAGLVRLMVEAEMRRRP